MINFASNITSRQQRAATPSTGSSYLRQTFQSQNSRKMEVLIIGKNSDPELEFIIQQSELWINNDTDSNEDLLYFSDCVDIEIVTLHQTHFDYILKELKRKSHDILNHSYNSPIILINSSRYVESLLHLITVFVTELGLPQEIFIRSIPYSFNQQNEYLLQLTQMTHSKLLQYFNFSETFTYVFFDIKLKNGFIECNKKVKSMHSININIQEVQKINQFRIIIQLNSKIMPKTCLNFYQLCQGNFKNSKGQRLTYKNTLFHAIQKNAFIQGGAFSEFEKDESIFGPTFEDENYAIKHDQPGIVGMANQGVPHTNASQFYITLGAQPDKDQKYVAFGLVVYGMKYLRKLNKITDRSSYTPAFEARIVNCGEYNFQKDDFVQETKKDFDLLDNLDQLNKQINIVNISKQERSASSLQSIRPKIGNSAQSRIQVKKDKDQYTSQRERFKSSFHQQEQKRLPSLQNQVDSLNSYKKIELVKAQDKEIFKQYKKELEDQPIFQFHNVNLLSDRGSGNLGNGHKNFRKTQQKFQFNSSNNKSNYLKFQTNSLGFSNHGSLPKNQMAKTNNDFRNMLIAQTLSPNIVQLPKGSTRNDIQKNGDQFLQILLNNASALSNNKKLNGQNQEQKQAQNSSNSNNHLELDQQQSDYNLDQNLSERQDQYSDNNFGSNLAHTYFKKQTTPIDSNNLLDCFNGGLMNNGQQLQFRKLPNIDKNSTNNANSFKNQKIQIGSLGSFNEFNKDKIVNHSIQNIQNDIKNLQTYMKQPSINNNHMFDDISQKILMSSKEEIGSLIIISQISQFKRFIAHQYQKKVQEDQMQELTKIIPGLSESIAMQLPISLKKSLSTYEQIFINKQLTQELLIPKIDTKNTVFNMSKQVGFDISEVDDDW
ncbi:peptidyl-prolyl cis-trans isomerase, cyclophilin-type protein (macronuclear) [Tetrahymena thermophila SB210]|uniref:Peptidyl-prolyl cis-trans isomerase, cyclophilin-type protein n=1 Tax=Tetrahymena thermophila (strain SB210) TaxID=312017 RepID=I7MIU8_TETTS|nr:peptidyl-prolyl cis-trans isomerase, cyclophilin-type protein [Tetrahymena thermophila SB210]EAS04762.2 peptidyl-prolyl cis-trans isomerase, cyclophilin-type protein [Tetrahymena thermophila SB210]|eukprot:XP_001025007.2 peptidyl-prolyl cis-trans isomerase, cyclophilin-type protein [Tetrahymena thermophila SB210]